MASEPGAKLRVHMLGDFELTGPTGPIRLSSRKQAGLLAYLAYTHPKRHSREKLMTLLWGTYMEPQARQNLRQALVGVRKILGDDVLVTEGESVSLLQASLACDAARFEALIREGSTESLREAVGLYRGPFLADLSIDEESWSEWLETERQRLEDLAIDAMVSLGEKYLAAGGANDALEVAKRAVALNPLREDAHRLTIKACVEGGRRSEAFRRYDELVALLKRELDVEPDEATSELIESLRASARPEVGGVHMTAPTRRPHEPKSTHWLDDSRAVLAVQPVAASRGSEVSARQGIERLATLSKGRLADRAGDTLLLDFPDARSAVRAGQAVQDAGVRMAAHTADVRHLAKNVASALIELSQPGQLVVTTEVTDFLTDGIDARLEDLGEHTIGTAGGVVRAFRLLPAAGGESDLRRPIASRVQPAIAVIPFSITPAESDKRAIGQLFADEIIASLCRSQELAVISRMSTRVFTGIDCRVAEIGERLRADYVIWGSCEVRGEQVGIWVELANATSEEVIWRGEFTSEISSLSQGGNEVIERIISETSAAVLNHELKRVQLQPFETLENYSILAAAISLIHRTSPTSFAYARELLERLTERLPLHPLPQAWLASWHLMKVSQGWAEDIGAEARVALDHAKRANDLDPTCSIAIAMNGWVHTHLLRRFDIAAERFELAVEMNSSDALAWLLKGTMHAFKGEGQAAIQGVEHALRLSPLDPRRSYYDSLAATAYLSAEKFDDAIELAKRSLRVNRLHSSTLRALIIAQVLSGRLGDARQNVPELLRIQPNLTVSDYLKTHPAAAYPVGKVWADALKKAGVPR
jgi:adenylate cyclase